MKTRQVGPGFAVEISDLALNELRDAADIEAFRQSWVDNKVAVLRDQKLNDDELLAFTRYMGPLFVHVRSMFHSREYPEIMFVSNLKADGRPLGSLGDGDLGWHTDQCYTARPCWGTLLYGIEIPSDGGNTYFADLHAAYEQMPDDLRADAEGKRVVYSVLADTISKKSPITAEQRAHTPDVSQPLIRTHPYTHRKALYVSPNHYVCIEGMQQAQSDALFDRLAQWVGQPQFIYTHRWRVGDVVLWDNASVVHRRDAFPSEQRRFLKRTGFHLPEGLAVPF